MCDSVSQLLTSCKCESRKQNRHSLVLVSRAQAQATHWSDHPRNHERNLILLVVESASFSVEITVIVLVTHLLFTRVAAAIYWGRYLSWLCFKWCHFNSMNSLEKNSLNSLMLKRLHRHRLVHPQLTSLSPKATTANHKWMKFPQKIYHSQTTTLKRQPVYYTPSIVSFNQYYTYLFVSYVPCPIGLYTNTE